MVQVFYNENRYEVVHEEVKMYIAVYVDSFFVFQLFMNLFVLGLVNGMLRQRIGKKKRLTGALIGALMSVVPLLLPINLYIRIGCAFGLSLICMIVFSFRIYNFDSFYRAAEKVVVSTLLLGGMTLVVLRLLKNMRIHNSGLSVVFLASFFSYLLLRKIMNRQDITENLCRVILYGDEKLEVQALIDTGNALTEPFSGKPVSVLDKSIFDNLFHQKPQLYRVIPYHSVGKKQGILEGYLVNRMIVETKGERKEYKEVYVGISEELTAKTGAYKMILNPKIME